MVRLSAQTLEMLRHCVSSGHDDWDEHLVMVELAISTDGRNLRRTNLLCLIMDSILLTQ